MTRDDLREALQSANVRAFLQAIREGEGTRGTNGYRTLYGGKLFDDYITHPNIATKAGKWTSTAAGAYQFLYKTWRGLIEQYGFEDFSPECQDEAAVALIAGRGALEDVKAGRIRDAVAKCAKEWASLPGSPYGQPTVSLETVLKVYRQAGGTLAEDKPMLPFVAAAIPALIEAAPALIRIFGDSPQSEKNAKAAEIVVNAAKTATGETTAEGAVAAIQSDPAKAAAYREAVHEKLSDLVALAVQATEAEDKSRDAATDRNLQLAKASDGKWLYLLAGIAIVVVLASYAITAGVLFSESSFSDETRAMLLGQIVVMGFATVVGFLFGSSIAGRVRDAKQS